MKHVKKMFETYSVLVGIFLGLAVIGLITILILSIPEEAGIAITIMALMCASVSMFFISQSLIDDRDGHREKSS
jgi:hypothetical protein